jgi:Spy/CpxP family protein refolding chaperone
METSARNKWQIRLAVLTIFVVGFVAGALATNFYSARRGPSSSQNIHGRFDRIFDRLNLAPDQKDQVKAIFDDARAQLAEVRKQSEPKFREVRKQTDERLQTVLTPEQWEQFQKMMAESKERRPRGRDRRERQP